MKTSELLQEAKEWRHDAWKPEHFEALDRAIKRYECEENMWEAIYEIEKQEKSGEK